MVKKLTSKGGQGSPANTNPQTETRKSGVVELKVSTHGFGGIRFTEEDVEAEIARIKQMGIAAADWDHRKQTGKLAKVSGKDGKLVDEPRPFNPLDILKTKEGKAAFENEDKLLALLADTNLWIRLKIQNNAFPFGPLPSGHPLNQTNGSYDPGWDYTTGRSKAAPHSTAPHQQGAAKPAEVEEVKPIPGWLRTIAKAHGAFTNKGPSKAKTAQAIASAASKGFKEATNSQEYMEVVFWMLEALKIAPTPTLQDKILDEIVGFIGSLGNFPESVRVAIAKPLAKFLTAHINTQSERLEKLEVKVGKPLGDLSSELAAMIDAAKAR